MTAITVQFLCLKDWPQFYHLFFFSRNLHAMSHSATSDALIFSLNLAFSVRTWDYAIWDFLHILLRLFKRGSGWRLIFQGWSTPNNLLSVQNRVFTETLALAREWQGLRSTAVIAICTNFLSLERSILFENKQIFMLLERKHHCSVA